MITKHAADIMFVCTLTLMNATPHEALPVVLLFVVICGAAELAGVELGVPLACFCPVEHHIVLQYWV